MTSISAISPLGFLKLGISRRARILEETISFCLKVISNELKPILQLPRFAHMKSSMVVGVPLIVSSAIVPETPPVPASRLYAAIRIVLLSTLLNQCGGKVIAAYSVYIPVKFDGL